MTIAPLDAKLATKLTLEFRKREAKRAAKQALLGSYSYQKIVNVKNPKTIDEWLDLIVPKVIEGNAASAMAAAAQYDTLRRIELGPEPEYAYKAQPVFNSVDEGIRHALASAATVKVEKSSEDAQWTELELKPFERSKLAGEIIRYTLNGGRATIEANTTADKTALGFVRVTSPSPCAFCAILASRGVNYRPYSADSFKLSNKRFEGSGSAKVHDSCGCSLKPVWRRDDELVAEAEKYQELWGEYAGTDTRTALRDFQRNYRAAGLAKTRSGT